MSINKKKLKYCGENVIIGDSVRIRYPELVELHDNSIIDDFVYISTGLILGPHCGIEPGCVIMGGQNQKIILEKYAAIASNTTAMCSTHDFKNGFHVFHNNDFPQGIISGDIILKDHAIVGSKCTILPGVTLDSGCRVGAHSLINQDLDAWALYAGTPIRKIGVIDQSEILSKMIKFEKTIK